MRLTTEYECVCVGEPGLISAMPPRAQLALAIPRRDTMIQPRSQRAAAVLDRGPEIFDVTLEKT